MFIFCMTLICGAKVANAQCRVSDNGESVLLGQFKYQYAYKDCMKVYRRVYLPKFNDGNSELYLKCKGEAQLIAVVRDFQLSITGTDVAGCAMPSTLG